MAPIKVLIVPLSAKEELQPLVQEVCKYGICYETFKGLMPARLATKLRREGVFSRVDDSTASIGKRYARNDELGTPFGITVDFACALF